MGAKRVEYQVVGRYMDGKEVTAYHLQSLDTGKSGKYTKEQLCFLVGRGQVTNCTGQIYQDKVLLRGKDISLEDLPVQYESGTTRNMDKVGKIRKGTNSSQAMEQLMIVGLVKSGNRVVKYILQNAGGGQTPVDRGQLLKLVQSGRIGNARLQNYNGKILLRGIGCKLDELPCIEE